jgi:PPOX class probable F420-dependent enzyme
MDIEQARAFVRENHRAVMATRRASSDPQLSPVLCSVDAEGRVCVSTRETALKVKNLRRDPRVSLCALNDGFFGEWVQIDGTAEIVSLPEAMDLLVEYYRSLAGEHPDWDEYRAAMERERRVLLRIQIERAGPDRSG